MAKVDRTMAVHKKIRLVNDWRRRDEKKRNRRRKRWFFLGGVGGFGEVGGIGEGIGDGGVSSSLEELEDDEAPRAFLPHVQAVFVPPPWLRSQEIARTYLLCSLHKQCSHVLLHVGDICKTLLSLFHAGCDVTENPT